MSDLVLKKMQQARLKKLVIARKIALNFDYCLDEVEAKSKMSKLLTVYFDKKKFTPKEIIGACAEYQGLRSDEVDNAIDRELSTLLNI